jgi:hypothetical protein
MSLQATSATADPIETLRRVFPKPEYLIAKMPDGDTGKNGAGASSWLSATKGRVSAFLGNQIDTFFDDKLGLWPLRDTSAKYRIQAPEGPALLRDLVLPGLGRRMNWALRDPLFITERGGSSLIITAANAARLLQNKNLGKLAKTLTKHETRCERPSQRRSWLKSKIRVSGPAEPDQPR